MRFWRHFVKREDRVKLNERLKTMDDRINNLEARIQNLEPKPSGAVNPARNGSNDGNDGNDRTEGLQVPAATLKHRGASFERQLTQTYADESELREDIKHDLAQAYRPSRGEGGDTIGEEEEVEEEEHGSNGDDEGNHQHNKLRNNKGKSPVTQDEDQTPQQQPTLSHPPRSSSRNALTRPVGPGSSLG